MMCIHVMYFSVVLVWATLTDYHQLCDLTEICFSLLWTLGSPRSELLQIWCLVGPASWLADGRPTPHAHDGDPTEREAKLSHLPLPKPCVGGPTVMTSQYRDLGDQGFDYEV